MTLKEKADMRKDGATYQQIADACGISRQAVQQQVSEFEKRRTYGIRGRQWYINNIRYKGIYDHFNNNAQESLSSFSRAIYGYTASRVAITRNFLCNGSETKFTINQIKRICKRCGKSFEEVFAERNIDE